MNSEEVLARLNRRLEALGLEELKAGELAGHHHAIRNFRRRVQAGQNPGMTTAILIDVARALETTVSWIVAGEGPEEISQQASRADLTRDMQAALARLELMAAKIQDQAAKNIQEWLDGLNAPAVASNAHIPDRRSDNRPTDAAFDAMQVSRGEQEIGRSPREKKQDQKPARPAARKSHL